MWKMGKIQSLTILASETLVSFDCDQFICLFDKLFDSYGNCGAIHTVKFLLLKCLFNSFKHTIYKTREFLLNLPLRHCKICKVKDASCFCSDCNFYYICTDCATDSHFVSFCKSKIGVENNFSKFVILCSDAATKSKFRNYIYSEILNNLKTRSLSKRYAYNNSRLIYIKETFEVICDYNY